MSPRLASFARRHFTKLMEAFGCRECSTVRPWGFDAIRRPALLGCSSCQRVTVHLPLGKKIFCVESETSTNTQRPEILAIRFQVQP